MSINACPPTVEKKLAVIGLDCVPSSFIFGEFGRELLNMRAMMEHGIWGPLRSTDPPITIPAWTTITTGRDPGELGLYGFRNRLNHQHYEMKTVNASHVEVPRVWDFIESAGGSSVLIGIPQTYPAAPHRGLTVSGFPTPDLGRVFTFPEELANEIPSVIGGDYITDVRQFRTEDKQGLLNDLYTMVDSRFRLANDFVIHKPWRFFMLVEIATDRLHHGFWRYYAADHHLHVSGNPWETVIPDFYKFLDERIGSFLARLTDDTTVIVVSDHGVRTMRGGVGINEWLIDNGLLCLRSEPDQETTLTADMVDWSRTKAWGEGGYYARIFINVKGRELEGVVTPEQYSSVREEIADRIVAMRDEKGERMNNRVLKPEQIYRACKNIPPDLMVYFEGLSRRSIGTVGTREIFRQGNETGPDDANHDHEGVFIMTRMSELRSGRLVGTRSENLSCLDVAPTILLELGVPIPEIMGGTFVQPGCSHNYVGSRVAEDTANHEHPRDDAPELAMGFSEEEEELVKQRLMELGYM